MPAYAASDGFNAVAFPVRVKMPDHFSPQFNLMGYKLGWWDGVFHDVDPAVETSPESTPQAYLNSLEPIPQGEYSTPSLAQLERYVELCRKSSMKLMLRVYISFDDYDVYKGTEYEDQMGSWRAYLQPGKTDDWNSWWRRWFEGYAAVIRLLGKIASQLQVEFFDIGVELNSTVGIRYYRVADNPEEWPQGIPAQGAAGLVEVNGWKQVILAARQHYPGVPGGGKVLYSANAGRPSSSKTFINEAGEKYLIQFEGNGESIWSKQLGGGYKDVDFWSDLDAIGVDYYPRTQKYWWPDKLDSAFEVWNDFLGNGSGEGGLDDQIANLEQWRVEEGLTGKPVIVSEFGCRSFVGAGPNDNTKPYEVGNPPASWEEQAIYLAGVLRAMAGRDWLAATFLYQWGSDYNGDLCPLLKGVDEPDKTHKYARNYPIVGKDAEIVFYAWNWGIGPLLLT